MLMSAHDGAVDHRIFIVGIFWLGMGMMRLQKTALSAGLRVSETKQEITVEAAMVVANWVKKGPRYRR